MDDLFGWAVRPRPLHDPLGVIMFDRKVNPLALLEWLAVESAVARLDVQIAVLHAGVDMAAQNGADVFDQAMIAHYFQREVE
jgi:hypothetical protein